MLIKTNDMQMAIYLSALIRSVIALHDLINNKIRYGEDGTELDNDKNNTAEKSSSSEEEKKEESPSDSNGKDDTKDKKEKDDTKGKK